VALVNHSYVWSVVGSFIMATIQQNIRFVKRLVSNMEPVTARLPLIGSTKERRIAQ